jgi:hypothetical protein
MTNTQTISITGGNWMGFNHFAPIGSKSGRGEQNREHIAHFLQNAACLFRQACTAAADNRELLLLAGTVTGFSAGALIMALDVSLSAVQ